VIELNKYVEFIGTSLEDLRAFPTTARREAGYQIDQVQHGLDPDNWKPLRTVGRGAREIRIRDESGAFRVIYIAKVEDRVYVLHAFQKKTQKTRKTDLDLAKKRYKEVAERLSS
jgi:phage-related protein